MLSIIINALAIIGSLFVLIAAIGVWRLPDFYTRVHAATKAGAFGGAILALASALTFWEPAAWIQAILLILFFYITTPVAAHLLGRAAYARNVFLFKKDSNKSS